MEEHELTMFQQSQLTYLRQQVDRFQEEKYKKGAGPNVGRDLFAAYEELDNYVSRLREIGKSI
jgi:hypothetical protein|tara:strand:- start:906 stop:1094 length:189 start_codon:yes stop_codon:yes gene_type:complete